MVSRYDNRPIGVNQTEQYADLLRERSLTKLRQYFSPNLRHPTPTETAQLQIIRHEWKVGDRYFKLAHKYYGDSKLWWVVAWYNQLPTDAHVRIGDVIEVPLPLELILKFMGL